MVNTYKAQRGRMRYGANKTADLAILETQLMISRLYTTPTLDHESRIHKFINIDDALDSLESLIAGKIRLGYEEWNQYHKLVKTNLQIPNLAHTNTERYRRLVSMRYILYNVVLQSLGYYATEIIRNELYDALGYNDIGQEQQPY
jgi:hypothetical protein